MSDELTFEAFDDDQETYVPGARVGRFRMYDVDVASIIGVNPAIVLHDLYDLFHYYMDKGQLLDRYGDKWFFYQEDECNKRTALTCDQGIGACNALIKQGLIQKRVMGQPGKRYFRINFPCLKHLIDMAQQRSECCQNKAKDNEILQNLERQKLGFLKPSFTPCQHYRIQREQIEEIRDRDAETPPSQTFAQCDNLFENGNTPTSQQKNIDLNPNLDSPKKKRHQKTKPDMLQFGSHVKLTMSDMKELVDTYGKQTIEAYILRVNRYCCASRPRGYHDYKAVILSWMDKDIGNAALAASRKPQPATNKDESREDRLAMGGKHINPALYALFVKQGRQMDEYVSDETLA